MDLKLIVQQLKKFANPHIACDWDNVGLLVEPSQPLVVNKILVTTDLTEAVFDEALEKHVNLIISYHPIIVSPLKRLTQSDWEQRSIIKLIENRIAAYCPHTTWDSRNEGINDWIMQAFDTFHVESVENNLDKDYPSNFAKSIQINLPCGAQLDSLINKISSYNNLKFLSQNEINSTDGFCECEFMASSSGVLILIDFVTEMFDVDTLRTLRIIAIQKPLMKNVGLGRIGYLKRPIKISEIIEIVKSYLNLKNFRLALGDGKSLADLVTIIAVGAGCCTDLLNNVNADFIITGEFLHHEILHETSRGVSLIVSDHSNTERGYLEFFKKKFDQILTNDKVELIISEADRDPLVYL